MALSQFQWIAVGLAIAVVLIPVVRWFWKKFDMPSKWALEILQQRENDEQEAEMWAGIESQVEAEKNEKRELEMKQKEKQERAGKSLDADESVDVWNKLGIDVPIEPVKREEPPPVVIENSSEIVDSYVESENSEKPEEPDWELVEKMSNLSEPLEGVPDAPDLEELSDEELESKEEDSGWADDW